MTDLRINLLGPPEILWENQLLNINRRTPRTLLYFLASQNNLIARRKLLSIFWQDSTTPIARRRLREALSRIRSAIPIPDFITIHNDFVGLETSNLSVDLKIFVELHDLIGNSPWTVSSDQILPDNIFQSMVRAVNLWRGTQFLEGIELPNSHLLDDWWYQTNLHLTQLRTRMLARIGDHYLAAGQIEDAFTYSKLAVESDNLNEDLHYRVLRILVETKRFQEARQYYLSVTKLLNDELDAQPSQQLVSIYRQINRKTHASSPSSRPDWRLLASIHTPFVGRKKEFNQIEAAMENGGGIIITGESGLGKTRLVQEYCELFATERRILGTHCRPAEINLPFQPFIELLRNNIAITEWKSFSNTWAELLALLLPEILPDFQSHDIPLVSSNPDQNRSTLFEAIRQVFLLVAQRNDLILFIDDLHWADEASISTIAYLIERAPFNKNALLILAARSDYSNQSIEKILYTNRSASNLDLIRIERLNHKEISGLGRYVMGYPLEQELVYQLDYETGGNPFIILETLHSLQDQESLSVHSSPSHLPLPKSVYTLIQNRIRQLSPAARDISEYAAVIGKEFDPVLISLANQQNLSFIARAIEELKQRHLVEAIHRPGQETTWQFTHDKIRETIILDTNRIRLRYLHERIAQAIESQMVSQSGNQAAVLARHYEYAGKLTTAFMYWTKAAQWARLLYSSSEALQILSRAESLILKTNEIIDDESIHDFYSEWTELAYEMLDAQLIRDHNNRLLELGQSKQSKLLIGTALNGLSDACMVENQFEEGLASTNQAIFYLKQTKNAYEIMNNHTNRGVFLYMLGRLDEAIQSFEIALSLGNSDNNPAVQRGMANAHYQLALCQTLAGWPESGLMNAKISLELANKIGHHHIAVTAYLASSLTQYFLVDYQKAREDNQKGIEIAERLQANRMLGYLYACKAFLDNASGDLGSAYELSQRILELGLEHNHQDIQSLAHRIRGDIYLLLNSYEKAREEFQLGSNNCSRDFWGLDNLVRFGYTQIATGQSEVGMVNLLRGIDLAQSGGFGMVEIRGMQFLSYAHISKGEWKLTRQVTEQLAHQARIHSLPMVGMLAKFIGGIADFNQSKPEENIEQLQYSLNFLGHEDQPYIALRILMHLIRLKKNSGFDNGQEILRFNDILNRCERLAYPAKVQETFQSYKKKMRLLISG